VEGRERGQGSMAVVGGRGRNYPNIVCKYELKKRNEYLNRPIKSNEFFESITQYLPTKKNQDWVTSEVLKKQYFSSYSKKLKGS
jgi:hypothetical protein